MKQIINVIKNRAYGKAGNGNEMESATRNGYKKCSVFFMDSLNSVLCHYSCTDYVFSVID